MDVPLITQNENEKDNRKNYIQIGDVEQSGSSILVVFVEFFGFCVHFVALMSSIGQMMTSENEIICSESAVQL